MFEPIRVSRGLRDLVPDRRLSAAWLVPVWYYMSVSALTQCGDRTINQYENRTIEVLTNGVVEAVARPILRELGAELGVNPLNGNGNPKTLGHLAPM
jgi:hypothetical protein